MTRLLSGLTLVLYVISFALFILERMCSALDGFLRAAIAIVDAIK